MLMSNAATGFFGFWGMHTLHRPALLRIPEAACHGMGLLGGF